MNIVSTLMGYHPNQGHGGGKVWMMKVWTMKVQGEEGIPEAELADSVACEVGLVNCGRITPFPCLKRE